MAELFVNDFSTALASGTTTTAGTVVVVSAAALPSPAGGDFAMLRIEPSPQDGSFELVKMIGRVGTTLTVQRAQEGTAGVAWLAGAKVTQILTRAGIISFGTTANAYTDAQIAAQPAEMAVVNYAGDLSAARPTAEFVRWVGFPSQPVNMADFDEWLDDTPETYPVQVVQYTGDLSAARPVATVVIWQNFPASPVNIVDGDMWVDPTTEGLLLSGTTVPGAGDGNNDDWWLRTTTKFLYGPKAGGVWPAGVSLIGPTGATGATGSTGSTGAAGADGVGVPVGGTTGQVLAKTSNTNYATGWSTPSSAGGYLPTFSFISGTYVLLYGASGGSTTGLTNQRLYTTPFYLPQSVSLTRIGCEVSAAGNAGAVMRIGVYTDIGGMPGNPEIDTTVAADAIASPEATISVTLAAGWHWAAACPQNAATTAPSVRTSTTVLPLGFLYSLGAAYVGAAASPGGYYKASVAGAFPTPYGTPPYTTIGNTPRLFFKVA